MTNRWRGCRSRRSLPPRQGRSLPAPRRTVPWGTLPNNRRRRRGERTGVAPVVATCVGPWSVAVLPAGRGPDAPRFARDQNRMYSRPGSPSGRRRPVFGWRIQPVGSRSMPTRSRNPRRDRGVGRVVSPVVVDEGVVRRVEEQEAPAAEQDVRDVPGSAGGRLDASGPASCRPSAVPRSCPSGAAPGGGDDGRHVVGAAARRRRRFAAA